MEGRRLNSDVPGVAWNHERKLKGCAREDDDVPDVDVYEHFDSPLASISTMVGRRKTMKASKDWIGSSQDHVSKALAPRLGGFDKVRNRRRGQE
jgi:hypothetical protein